MKKGQHSFKYMILQIQIESKERIITRVLLPVCKRRQLWQSNILSIQDLK